MYIYGVIRCKSQTPRIKKRKKEKERGKERKEGRIKRYLIIANFQGPDELWPQNRGKALHHIMGYKTNQKINISSGNIRSHEQESHRIL